MSEKQHYCSYPFSQMTIAPTGQYKLCCSSSEAFGAVSDFAGSFDLNVKDTSLSDYWNGVYLNWVRAQHLANAPIKECRACYFYEQHGNESYRQRALQELGTFAKPLAQPRSLDLKLGNKCNASCLFCDPSSSSTVLSEWKEIGWDKAPPFESGLTGWVSPELFDVDYAWAEREEFWEQLKQITPEIKNLKFTGGEPLINRYMIKYLDWIVQQGWASDMRLQVTTNGIVVPQKFLDFTEKFRLVEINFSVDGFGPQNEYIRYPTKWKNWLANVERVQSRVGSNVSLFFQHSVSAYSVFGLEEYFRWMWPYKRFGFHLFKVFHPDIQRTELLSRAEKIQTAEALERLVQELGTSVECKRDEELLSEIKGIAKMILQEEDRSGEKPRLREFLHRLDQHRQISIWDYMPLAAHSLGMPQKAGE